MAFWIISPSYPAVNKVGANDFTKIASILNTVSNPNTDGFTLCSLSAVIERADVQCTVNVTLVLVRENYGTDLQPL